MNNGLAANSWRTYNVGFRHYLRFCGHLHLPVWPLNEYRLEIFVTSLSKSIAVKSIKVYLCGIQAHARLQGYGNPISGMVRLSELLRGIRRTQGDTFLRRPRLPVTPALLRRLMHGIRASHSVRDSRMLVAAVTLAFFGLLRVSEYTCPTVRCFDRNTNLLVGDISLDPSGRLVRVKIKASKTDPFRQGGEVRVGATGTDICPVRAVREYVESRQRSLGPAFVFENGRFLTRSYLSALLHRCLGQQVSINTHSFRIGGASAMAAAGIPAYLIQILGRWKSDAFLAYIRVPDRFTEVTSAKMANTD